MDQQQIDIIHFQPFQTVFNRGQYGVDRRIVPLRTVEHFGGDEQVGTGDAGGAHPFADFPLIAIHARGVDMAVA